jgi:hypothetical protein
MIRVKRRMKMAKRLELTIAQLENAVVEYKDGATLSDVAAGLGCSIPTASRILKKEGVEVRGRGERKKVEAVEPETLEPFSEEIEEERRRVIEEAEDLGFRQEV